MKKIILDHIYKDFQETRVLKGINASFEFGQRYVIQGASGSGKSTLLYLIGGLDRPSSGHVIVGEKKISEMNDEQLAHYRNTEVGFVFQFHFLLPSMNSMDNILLPCRIAGRKVKDIKDRVSFFAEKLAVSHCLDKFPYELSGGEQQRVNIIRALSLHPKLLLCDEPTGNLDSKNTEKVVELLHEMAIQMGSTLIVVTHDEKVSQTFKKKFVIEDGCFIS